MKLPIQHMAIAAAAGGMLAQTLQAGQITGNISFTGEVTLNTSSPATATAVPSWLNPTVAGATGAFALIPAATAVTFAAPWNFYTSGPIPNFWSAGGFTFELTSSAILSQGGTPGVNGFVTVLGTGTASGNGYSSTTVSWSFTCQDPRAGFNPNSWTFSASSVSQVTPPPVISSRATTNGLILSWTDSSFALQVATNLNGSFSNISGATSPFTNRFTSSQQFFRLNK
jgi:hypothetical protein